jgi:hypothetical protein
VETTAAEGVIDCEKDGAGQELSFAGGEHTPIPTSVRRSRRKVSGIQGIGRLSEPVSYRSR